MRDDLSQLANKWASSTPANIAYSRNAIARFRHAHRVSLVTAYKIVDELNRGVEAISPRLACKNGCNHCCTKVRVRAETGALDLIIERIKSDADLLTMVQDNIKALPEEDDILAVKCPLLNAEGRCSVYDIRPINCRAHHSLDEVACKSTSDGVKVDMQRVINFDVVALAFNSGLIAKYDKHGKTPQTVVLHQYVKGKLNAL